MMETFQNVVMHFAICGLCITIVLSVAQSRTVLSAVTRLLAIWRNLTSLGRVVVCAFLMIGVIYGSSKTNSPPRMMMRSSTATQLTYAEKKAQNWNIRGAWRDSFWLKFADGWRFPSGTNHLYGVEVISFGQLWPTPFNTNAVASLGSRVEIVPGLSSFVYELTPSNSYLFSWDNAAINRDTNNLVTASFELFRNGDIAVTTNGVAKYIPRVLPFPHNGFGQDDEWVEANFTNATDILAVGYPQWVDIQVGAGLTNGLYKLTVTVSDDPPETTQISVGNLSVAVTNAGEYVFLLEKGPAYDMTVFPPSSNVTISAVDDLPMMQGLLSSRSIGGTGYSNGEWVPDSGTFWTDYVVGMGHARLWWLPWLCGAPGVEHMGPDDGPLTFRAVLSDCRCANDVAYSWSADDGFVVASPNSQTTEISASEMPSWAEASISVTASFGGNSLTSYTDGFTYGTNATPQVHLSLNIPSAILLNSNEVSAAKIAQAGWAFSSDAPTSGTVRVTCLSGCDKVRSTGLLGDWSVYDASSVAATIEGLDKSTSVGDVTFRMEFVGCGVTNAVERSLTVVRTCDVVLPSASADGLVVLVNTPVAMEVSCEPQGSSGFLSTTWHTRRLKSDGTYDEWQLAVYDRPGASFSFTPTLGGIYQIRALAGVEAGGADERFYVWEADENRTIGARRKGNLKSLGVVSLGWQKDLCDCAKAFVGSTAYLSTESLSAQFGFPAYPAGDMIFKCNIFVAHRIVESGLPCPATRGWFNSYPPLANDWANLTYEIGSWIPLSTGEYPQPGYVFADPDPDASGHMGIIDFDGYGISAGTANVNRHFEVNSPSIVIRKLREDNL